MLAVSIIELIIMLVSAGLIIPQIFLLKKQIKDGHEERRRENTVRIMESWCLSVKKDTCIAEQVARKLNREQCKKLYKHEAFTISKEIKNDVCKFCPLDSCDCNECSLKNEHGEYVLDGKILTELRWHVITYLNTLETVMVAWHIGAVDRDIIEEQFQFLTDANKGMTLSEFRHSAGGFPMIEEFIDEIKKDKPKNPKKDIMN